MVYIDYPINAHHSSPYMHHCILITRLIGPVCIPYHPPNRTVVGQEGISQATQRVQAAEGLAEGLPTERARRQEGTAKG